MAKRAKNTGLKSRELSSADLKMAITQIGRRITDLKNFDVNTITEQFDAKTQALNKKINSTLADIYGHGTVEYRKYIIHTLEDLPLSTGRKVSLDGVISATQKGIGDAVIKLESLKETLQEKLQDVTVPEEMSSFYAKPPERTVAIMNRKVFIVHGHDEAAKFAVVSFIGKLDLTPVILHEQPNKGRTIIEKFQDHSDVGFAVVLMTPDDIGALAKEKDKLNPRARQNVILELGFFLGKLGRKHVCALYKENVEIPSDYKGVLFIPMDASNGWQLSLAKEIKAAGIDIDLNKVL
jgi:predicted nucleotide-binding protein